jgi:hypothetical protein
MESLTNPLTIPGQTQPKESTNLLQPMHKYEELTCRKMATTRQESDPQHDCYCRIAPCPAPQEFQTQFQTKIQSCLQRTSNLFKRSSMVRPRLPSRNRWGKACLSAHSSQGESSMNRWPIRFAQSRANPTQRVGKTPSSLQPYTNTKN